MKLAGLKNLHAKAWLARFGGDLHEASALLVSAKVMLGFRLGDLDLGELKDLLQTPLKDFATVADIYCLLASMERSRGELKDADRILSMVEQGSKSRGVTPTYNFYLQKGLNNLIVGHYATALEYFIAGDMKGIDNLARTVLITNQIVCMEAMGQDIEGLLDHVKTILEECPKTEVKRFITDQINALMARQHRRRGDIAAALALEDNKAHISQVDYILQTIRQLPYIADHATDANSWNVFISNHRKLQHGSYRLRTLLGQYDDRDYELCCPQVVADRLYFWVWLWLKEPASFGVVKVIELLKRLRIDQNVWAVEDIRLVRIALLWLGLFSETSKAEIMSTTAVFPRSEAKMPLFDLEEMVISYFYELKSKNTALAEDILQSLEAHPLYDSEDIKLGRLVKLRPEPGLANLVHSLVGITEVGEDIGEFQVDLRSRTVHCLSASYANRSRTLAVALKLLHDKPYVGFQEMLKECFGISRYDPIVHDKKVHNLLYRLRKIPRIPITFRTKDGLIFSEGDWGAFHFIEPSQHERTLVLFKNWLPLLGSSESVAPAPSKATSSGASVDLGTLEDKWVSRSEIQRVLQKPRSTTSRLIKSWVEKGLIRKKGQTKNSLYQIDTSLLHQIQKEPL